MSKVASATKWSILTEFSVKLISPITNMVLARLLAPELFGIVASITLVTTFTDVFTDAGFQKYIIQHQFRDEEDFALSTNVAFWTNFIISCVLWTGIFIFRDSISDFVGCEGYGTAVSVASVVLICTAFSSIQMAIYKKNFYFKRLFIVRIICKSIPLIITVPLALLGFGYWSLIVGNTVGELVNAVILTVLSDWKPKLKYSFQKLKEMYSFCGWTLCEAVTAWLIANLSILLIGQTFNAEALGLYKGAITVTNQVLSIVTSVMSSVLLTTLSSYQNDKEEYKRVYLNAQRMVAMFLFPLGIGMFVYRDLLTEILLGSQWDAASILVGVWGFVCSINIIFSNMSSYLIISNGKPKYTFISNLLQCALILFVFSAVKSNGFLTAFFCIAACALQLSITQEIFSRKVFLIPFREKIQNVFPYIISAILMGCVGMFCCYITKNFVIQLLSVLLCIAIYFGVLIINKRERALIIAAIVGILKKIKIKKGIIKCLTCIIK